MDFSNKFLPLSKNIDASVLGNLAEAKKQGAVFAYGNFLTVGLNFFIVAFAMFLVVKAINRAKSLNKKEEEAVPAAPSKEEVLLTEIRDLLKSKVLFFRRARCHEHRCLPFRRVVRSQITERAVDRRLQGVGTEGNDPAEHGRDQPLHRGRGVFGGETTVVVAERSGPRGIATESECQRPAAI
jgi:large conductance mechanosensitive channel protein